MEWGPSLFHSFIQISRAQDHHGPLVFNFFTIFFALKLFSTSSPERKYRFLQKALQFNLYAYFSQVCSSDDDISIIRVVA